MATTTPAHAENYDPSTFWVDPSRNFKTSARLHLQHFLFQNTIGHLLEPAVEESIANNPQQGQQQLKVADLACGNGIWLCELHSALTKANLPPAQVQLDGFDINPVNFPAPAYLPPGVSLTQLDILATPLPAGLLGAYDVVHIRAFVSIIPDADALEPVLAAASKLLKPGGFLQWEETRGDSFTVESPSPQTIPTTACDGVVRVMKAGAEARGIRNDWVDVLDAHLGKYGFEGARLRRHVVRRQDLKGWTDDYLMVWDDLAVFFPPRAKDPDAQMTREAWLELFAAAVGETENGVVIHQGAVVVAVGQKPL